MLAKQKQVIEMYQRVQDFLGAYPPPPSTGYTIQKKNLDEVVARLTGHSTDQSAGRRLSRMETQRLRALRRKLLEEHLAPLAKIARAALRDAPGMEKALEVPSSNLATTRLLQEASAMRAAVAPHVQTFVESGRPDDFLAQLDAMIEEARGSFLGKARSVGTHVGAKHGLKNEIRRGRKTVDFLDTIARAAFRNSPDALAKWRVAKRVRLLPRGLAGTVDTVLPAPDTAPEAPVPQLVVT